jgi:hypothetical protein
MLFLIESTCAGFFLWYIYFVSNKQQHMKQITTAQIEKLVSKYQDKPGFRATPVYNFLGTAHLCGSEIDARANLDMDSKMYRWKAPIVKAISEGLKLAR